MKNKLSELEEMSLRQFLDAENGKVILDILVGRIVETQRRSMLSLHVNDEASEKRLIAERHKLTGAELLQRQLFVELEKYLKPAKSE